MTTGINELENVIQQYEESLFFVASLLKKDREEAEKLVIDTFLYMENELTSFPKKDASFDYWFVSNAVAYMFREGSFSFRNHPNLKDELINSTFKALGPFSQQTVILHYIFSIPIASISSLLNSSIEDIQNRIISFQLELIGELRSSEGMGSDCIQIEQLVRYSQEMLPEETATSARDHLEFCPSCRTKLALTTDVLQKVQLYFQPVPLETSILTPLLHKQQPPTKKKSFLYQIIAAASIVAIFGITIWNMPKIEHWTELANNYMKYGEFYNVWPEGTYVTEVSNIAFEVTNVEVTPIMMRVDFQVESERDFMYPNEHPLSEQIGKPLFDIRSYAGHNTFTIKTEDKIIPIRNITIFNKNFDGTAGSFFLDLKEMDGDIPDVFDLFFFTTRIGNYFGPWKLEVPINYKDGVKKVDTVALEKSVTVKDNILISLDEWVTGSVGSSLRYKMDVSEDVIETDVRVNYNLENELGEKVIPHPISFAYSSPRHFGRGSGNDNHELEWYGFNQGSNEQLFLPYLLTSNEEKQVKPLDDKERLYLSLYEVQYFEEIDVVIPIPLSEIENEPIQYSFDGTHFEIVLVRKVEGELANIYDVNIFGKEDDNLSIRNFYWFFDHEFGFTVFPYPDYHRGSNDPDAYGQFQITVFEDNVETVYIKANAVETTIQLQDPIKIPLY